MLIAGLDEAGRGPVLGPLVIGCVIFKESQLKDLDTWGIDDSKRLSHKKRVEYAKIIKSNCVQWRVFVITPEMINDLHYAQNLTLNQIEEMHFAKILNEIDPKPEEIFLDACDTVEARFGETIKKQLRFKPKRVISKHNGDSIFKVVGASSILAKVERDMIIQSYHDTYGPCGSGYPSDKYTRQFLINYYKKNTSFPPITRLWWKTVENIEKSVKEEKTQRKLTDF